MQVCLYFIFVKVQDCLMKDWYSPTPIGLKYLIMIDG